MPHLYNNPDSALGPTALITWERIAIQSGSDFDWNSVKSSSRGWHDQNDHHRSFCPPSRGGQLIGPATLRRLLVPPRC